MSDFIPWVLVGRENERPEGVSGNDVVDALFRDGEVVRGKAKTFLWLQFGEDDDVVGYRKVSP